MPVIINGSTGLSGTDGSAATPAVQGTDTNTGMFFPAADTIAFAEGGVEALRLDSSGNATFTGTVQTAGITTNLYPLVPATAVASTSGTFIDFTGIPSWVRRITVMLNGVSTNGAANLLVQIGAGSVTSSGYNSSSALAGPTTVGTGTVTSGFAIFNNASTSFTTGIFTIANVSGNVWVMAGSFGVDNTSYAGTSGGRVTLSGVLDRIRIGTANGTDVFDAGSINIMYE